MISKLASGLVVVFWLGMMAALVQLEFFPPPEPGGKVPSEQVLSRIFSRSEPTYLHVFYHGASIGDCMIAANPETKPDPADPAISNTMYRVQTDLSLKMSVFGMPSKLVMVGKSLFSRTYTIQNFHITTTISNGTVSLHGDATTKKVQVEFKFGDTIERREFDFDQARGAGLASALGLPDLANFSFPGAGSAPTAFQGPTTAPGAPTPVTIIYRSHLKVGETSLPAFVIKSKLDQSLWAKIWISEEGEVLRVDTSMGLTMLTDQLAGQPELARHQAWNDSY